MDWPMSCGCLKQVSAQIQVIDTWDRSEGDRLTWSQAVIYPFSQQRQRKKNHQVFSPLPDEPTLSSIVIAFNSLKFIVTHVTNRAELAAAKCWSSFVENVIVTHVTHSGWAKVCLCWNIAETYVSAETYVKFHCATVAQWNLCHFLVCHILMSL